MLGRFQVSHDEPNLSPPVILPYFHEKAGSCQALFWVVSTVGLHW